MLALDFFPSSGWPGISVKDRAGSPENLVGLLTSLGATEFEKNIYLVSTTGFWISWSQQLTRDPNAYNSRCIPTFPDKPHQEPSPLNCLDLLRQLKSQINVIQ